ncbi:hypothetical protein ABW20_dc0104359 [Dactylellina cionopaga]|nr:hypothetical protein ABW20_dc0104359 [Dactylellina cionopaga]
MQRAVRYAPACSCIGVTRTTTTIASPSITTITATVSVTSTISEIAATATARVFLLQLQNHYQSAYAKVGTETGQPTTELNINKAEAAKFYLHPSGDSLYAIGYGQARTQDFGVDTSFIYLGVAIYPLYCEIATDFVISCESGTKFMQFGTYGNNFSLFMGYDGMNWANWSGGAQSPLKPFP